MTMDSCEGELIEVVYLSLFFLYSYISCRSVKKVWCNACYSVKKVYLCSDYSVEKMYCIAEYSVEKVCFYALTA